MLINYKYNKLLQIKGNKTWKSLNKCIVKNKIVDIVGCYSVFPEGPLLFNAETVFFRNCDGNLQYYWLNNTKFPNIQNIYINTYFEPQVYQRFTPDVNIYITDNVIDKWYKIENNKLDLGRRNITIITNDYLNYILRIASE